MCRRSDSYIDPESTYAFQLSASAEHLNDLEPRTIRHGVSTDELSSVMRSSVTGRMAAILGDLMPCKAFAGPVEWLRSLVT